MSMIATTNHWIAYMHPDIVLGPRDFFCLKCFGIFEFNSCECEDGEQETKRLAADPTLKAWWCKHCSMNIIRHHCEECLSIPVPSPKPKYVRPRSPLRVDYDSSDEDDVWSRFCDEQRGLGTW